MNSCCAAGPLFNLFSFSQNKYAFGASWLSSRSNLSKASLIRNLFFVNIIDILIWYYLISCATNLRISCPTVLSNSKKIPNLSTKLIRSHVIDWDEKDSKSTNKNIVIWSRLMCTDMNCSNVTSWVIKAGKKLVKNLNLLQ